MTAGKFCLKDDLPGNAAFALDRTPIPTLTPVGTVGTYVCHAGKFLATGNVEGVTTYDVPCEVDGPDKGWVFPATWPECVPYKECPDPPNVPADIKVSMTYKTGFDKITNGATAT